MFTATKFDGEKIEVKYLKIKVCPRYWEDAEVNDVTDYEGILVPFRNGDFWECVIDLGSGMVLDWPGVYMTTCYKVADQGRYYLLDENKVIVAQAKSTFVPELLLNGSNWIEYLELIINKDGFIQGWRNPDLSKTSWINPTGDFK